MADPEVHGSWTHTVEVDLERGLYEAERVVAQLLTHLRHQAAGGLAKARVHIRAETSSGPMAVPAAPAEAGAPPAPGQPAGS